MTQNAIGIPPGNFVYERRSSTISNPIPALTTNYTLLRWIKPTDREKFMLYGIGSDQHQNSIYTWVVDNITLPISGEARVGSPEIPYIFPEPILVSGSIIMYVSNNGVVGYPRVDATDPDAEYSYECLIYGRYV